MKDYKGIMVICELQKDSVVENSLELLSEAQRIKSKLDHKPQVSALIIGHDLDEHLDLLSKAGAEKIICIEDKKFADYRPDLYAEAMTKTIDDLKPEIVLIGATMRGEELGPTIAKQLDTGMAAHCVEFKVLEDQSFVQVVPAFGGKVLGDILCPNHRPQMASMKSGIAKKENFDFKPDIMKLSPDVKGFEDQIEVLEVTYDVTEKVTLHDSEIVITGGFGIGSQGGWDKIEKLANLLGGVTGCTRPALDEGWTSLEETMIGTSGVAIKPKVYIGFGISGAAHHTCGIKDADTIISVNNDALAPIFDYSDFKIVSDWEEVADALIEKLS